MGYRHSATTFPAICVLSDIVNNSFRACKAQTCVVQTDKSAVISITLRNYPSPSVGAREDDVGLGGPSWSPVGMGCAARSSGSQQGRGPGAQPRRVTMRVTPTDHAAASISSWLRLMPIRLALGTHL